MRYTPARRYHRCRVLLKLARVSVPTARNSLFYSLSLSLSVECGLAGLLF